MPRQKTEAAAYLELYKLVNERTRLQLELKNLDDRRDRIQARLEVLDRQVAEQELDAHQLRDTAPAAAPIVASASKADSFNTLFLEY
ncbi:hypothetical protein H6F43_20315 [Leptolyngbya sp. FACHB-36]|uniref:hypothetical protein n=1 Tax=Leptolyngbya sp. FACHB-36 TaxID=2692808 RepID=UPI001680F2C2|nr:hypothetical protein [Leptolyngbya sp. FACHB-36]MBD2022529.1 hypothetical protein [Leptolyngbya sp. FACHB-36]